MMRMINLLNIRRKILLVAGIALIGYVALLLVSGLSIRQTNQQVSTIQSIYYPVLERATFNAVQLERMVESFQTAVTIGDSEPLALASELLDQMEAAFALQEQKLPASSQNIAQMRELTQTYYQSARGLAEGMIDGTVDFEKLPDMAAEASLQLESLKAQLSDFQSQSEQSFNQLVSTIDTRGDRTLDTMIVASLVVLAILVLSAWGISRHIAQSVNRVTDSLKEIAKGDGDLTLRVRYDGQDELGELVKWFNLFIDKLQGTISSTITSINELSQVSEQLASSSQQTEAQIHAQGTAIEQTTQALETLFSSVDEIAEHASSASDAAADADNEAKTSSQVVDTTIRMINDLAGEVDTTAEIITRLEGYSSNVGVILETIRGIAEQTNLLALNAAIEAARAGEQGRGFAVVADEVRTLASRTQDSTHEIQQVLEELQQASKSAVTAMDQGSQTARQSVEQSARADSSLTTITEKVAAITVVNEQIASATQEQSQTSGSIQRYVTEIQQMAHETVQSTSALEQVCQSIQSITGQLNQVTNQFRV